MVQKKSKEANVFGGAWSIQKLDCISNYLESYLQVFQNQSWADLWYIDAFCGDGRQGLKASDVEIWPANDSEVADFVEGSALRALRKAADNEEKGLKSFDHFVFIDIEKGKLDVLEARISEQYPGLIHKCHFIAEDVNVALPQVISGINWRKGRAVSFLDPYATQLNWTTLEAFKGTKADIWMLFPLEAIIRMLPIKNMPNDAWSERLDRVFGDSKWRNLYYDPTINQPTLFEMDEEKRERHRGIEELLNYATKRFRETFPCVLEPGILRSDKNNPLFALYAIVTNGSDKAQDKAVRIARHLITHLNE